jgi:capsule polysaccharide modification protein KpsS
VTRPSFRGEHVLLLQGPAGPFFRHVADLLEKSGARVTKVNFNPGDSLFFRGPNVIKYRGTLEAWPDALTAIVRERQVTCLLLFGDCRPYHRRAIDRARALQLRTFVLEEGYVRPDYVTLEEGGVNGFSTVPRDPEFYRQLPTPRQPEPRPVGNTMPKATRRAIAHALACTLFGFRYPHYQHHRDVNAFRQGPLWARGYLRKLQRRREDARIEAALATTQAKRYFIVPLQVQIDFQLLHSPFESVRDFIAAIIPSFAAHAPSDVVLVVKHHPMDRAYNDYGPLLRELAAAHAVTDRIWYADSIRLPLALDHAIGAIVINSTVGLSAVHHGTPTKCLGTAIYDMEGLTHQGPLDEFWKHPGTVDRELYEKFRSWLVENTQLNGSVWSRLWEPL